MNKLGIYTLSVFMTLAYVTSVVGVGVHTCQHSGEQRIVLLTHDACRCGHEHEETSSCAAEDQGCCGHENHQCSTEESCCDFTYQALKVDQEAHGAKSLLKNFSEYFTWLFVPVTTQELPHATPLLACDHSPPPITANTLPNIYRLSQLRL
jgi:hypothetical protein